MVDIATAHKDVEKFQEALKELIQLTISSFEEKHAGLTMDIELNRFVSSSRTEYYYTPTVKLSIK